MLFICYPGCSTCQKARKWLDERRIRYTVRDIKTDNPTFDELSRWHAQSGLSLRRFFNTSGLQYRALGLKDRLPGMPEDDMLHLLSTDGMLIRRPLVIWDGGVLVGFRENEWQKALTTPGDPE